MDAKPTPKKRASRPCAICRKWFTPPPRSRRTQRTCGKPECKKALRAKTQAAWRKRNPHYWTNKRLAEDVARAKAEQPVPAKSQPPLVGQMPADIVQDVVGSQAYVIIAFLMRLLDRSMQDVVGVQGAVLAEDFAELPPPPPQDVIGDPDRPP